MKEKQKSSKNAIKSAFLKTNSLQVIIQIGAGESITKGLHPDTLIRIKIEVDSDPLQGFRTENICLQAPAPVSIRTVIKELHAALYRVRGKTV